MRAPLTLLLSLAVACGAKEPEDSGGCDDPLVLFRDLDGDGVGGDEVQACVALEGFVAEGGDCDDRDPTRAPGLSENSAFCDGVDNDCDEAIDEGQGERWFPDADGDGQGAPEGSLLSCTQPSGHVADNRDCDDSDPTVGAGFEEVCDGVDNSCDGRVDLTVEAQGYIDVDGDGYGDTETHDVCQAVVEEGGDCDEGDAAVSPGAPETCDDGVDNDCDGLLDCEDGGCMRDAWCVERDCDDGDDEDFDGLIDCFDEDCWSEDCGVLEVGVLTGEAFSALVLYQRRSDGSSWYRDSASGARVSSVSTRWSRAESRMRVQAYDVTGYARWRVGSGTATCGWMVDSLRWRDSLSRQVRQGHVHGSPRSSSRSSTYQVGPVRAGFVLSSACPFSATSGQLLPQTFREPAYSNRVQPLRSSGGGAWYEPATTWLVDTGNGGSVVRGVSDSRYFFADSTSYNSAMGWGSTTSAGGYHWEWFHVGSAYSVMQLSVPEVWSGQPRSTEWRP